MRLRCRLREIRGKRKLVELAEQSGVGQPYLSQLESGRLLPRDEWISALEDAYGEPVTEWYGRRALLAFEEDEAA